MTDFDKLDELEEIAKMARGLSPAYDEDDYGDDCDAPIDVASSEAPSAARPKSIESVAKVWSQSGQAFFPSEETVKTLPPGYYTVEANNRGLYFQQHPMNLDDLLILPDTASEDILKQIEFFWTREAKFRELGFLWKRGIMLYGPAGGGKTSTLQLLSKKIIAAGGISVYLKAPDVTSTGLKVLRRIEPRRPIIVLIEDIDAIIKSYGESEILAILDGELQIDNVVFIATTNYPEDLDRRLINRPSRFDVIKKIGMPSQAARGIYLRTKNPRLVESPDEFKSWVNETKGYSIAHLKELILAVEALDEPFDDVIKRLNKMMTTKPTSDDSERSAGFLSNEEL